MVAPVMKPAAGDRRKHTAPDTCVCVVCVKNRQVVYIVVKKKVIELRVLSFLYS